MPWKPITVNANAERVPWISIGVSKRHNGYSQTKITLSRSVVDHLHLTNGDQIVIHQGTDDHLGWVKITRAITGHPGFTISSRKQGKGNLAVRMSSRHLNLPTHKTTKVTMDDARLILDNGSPGGLLRSIIFELPEWAQKENTNG